MPPATTIRYNNGHLNANRSLVPTRTKTQKKKAAPTVKRKSAVKSAKTKKPAVKRARKASKPKLSAAAPVETVVDHKRVTQHLTSLRNLSDLPPINLDDLIRSDEPLPFMSMVDTAPEEQHLSLRSRISFYIGVFFGAVVVHVLVVVFLTAVSF